MGKSRRRLKYRVPKRGQKAADAVDSLLPSWDKLNSNLYHPEADTISTQLEVRLGGTRGNTPVVGLRMPGDDPRSSSSRVREGVDPELVDVSTWKPLSEGEYEAGKDILKDYIEEGYTVGNVHAVRDENARTTTNFYFDGTKEEIELTWRSAISDAKEDVDRIDRELKDQGIHRMDASPRQVA